MLEVNLSRYLSCKNIIKTLKKLNQEDSCLKMDMNLGKLKKLSNYENYKN